MSLTRAATPSESKNSRAGGRSRAFAWYGVLPILVAAGCVRQPGGEPGVTKLPRDAKEAAARLEKMMARENGPFSKHKVDLLDGVASGEIESATPPKSECKKDDGGINICSFEVDLGKDEDGDPLNIICGATAKFEAFGPAVKGLLREAHLEETPRLEVKPIGEGIAVSFLANMAMEANNSISIGTLKVANLYAHGYLASCFDHGAGGRKTFTRIVEGYFQSLKFKDRPDRPAMYAFGYRKRSGERTNGFRYGFITTEPGADGGFTESETSFGLDTDGKTWTVLDVGRETVHDQKGAVESQHELVWSDGKGPLVLSAKPSEGGKFRLKFELGSRSNALESTPKAPFQTELWSAPDLLKVSTGGAPSYRYAVLGMNEDDPSFLYVTLTRAKPGVLLEEVESSKRKKSASNGEPQPKDELEVDARGLVTKQVSTDAVLELVYNWGQWPPARSTAKKKGTGK